LRGHFICVTQTLMPDDNVKIFILDNYIRRLWGWLATLGSLFAIAAVVIFYERMGILKPIRSCFVSWELQAWSMTAFSATVACVTVACLAGFFMRRKVTSIAASSPIPLSSNKVEGDPALASAILNRIRTYESVSLFFSACPALLGIFLFIIGRPGDILLLYMGISLVMCIIFLPSLEYTEKTVNAHIEQHGGRLDPEVSSE